MTVGIEAINLYGGRARLAIPDLVAARGLDATYVADTLMCHERTVLPLWEDAVTLAVNAAKPLLASIDPADIELLAVGTESALDFGKPVSTWIHRYLGLPDACRNFEVKHACYSATAALTMAASWVASGVRPGKKALVIASDFSRGHFGENAEAICGGGAVALLISDQPAILELPLQCSGYWTTEVADTFRPTARDEVADSELSLFSYLDALDGAYGQYEAAIGSHDYRSRFRRHIYHAPFPGMTWQAHRSLLNRIGGLSRAEIRQDYDERVKPGLRYAHRLGSMYGGSNAVSLLGLLSAGELAAGDRVSLFAYGSGCQGEFYEGIVGPSAVERVRALELDARLGDRVAVSVADYERMEQERADSIDQANLQPRQDGNTLYDRAYADQGLLVLDRIEGFRRSYAWS